MISFATSNKFSLDSPLKFWGCVLPSLQVLAPGFQGGSPHAQAMYAWREAVNCLSNQPETRPGDVSLCACTKEDYGA